MKPAITFLLFFALLSGAAFAADEDYNADSEAAAVTLQHFYNQRGLWKTTDWWNAANCVEALENVTAADNGARYIPVLENTFRRNCATNFINEYYDDEGWWTLAWIRAYDLTGNAKYLKAAKIIFNDLTNGWSAHCEGGLIWRKKYRYKNAIPNELFLEAAIRLHQRTPEDAGTNSYLNWALREWDWFKNTGMINGGNLVNDGLNRNCDNDGKTTWTYNQGVILGGLTDLYKTTGDTNYLAQAMAIADAATAILVDENGVLQEPCEERDCPGGDTPQFKGIFIRNLAYLYDETHKPAYLAFLLKNERAVWANDRDQNNYLGLKWDGPFDFADGARQSSAMIALSSLIEPRTAELPFCEAAGSPGFSHEVGTPVETLGWMCSPENTTNAGWMLSGACATLDAGKHTAHFRMALNAPVQTVAKLVRLEIADDAAGKTLVSRDISTTQFTTGQSMQDFAVPFELAVAGEKVLLRVYWEGEANTPALILMDVTVDGFENWTAANAEHDIGRLDGLNGWEADPVRDTASGCLVKVRAGELAAGKYSVRSELKVDNFNWDKARVATLTVKDAGTGKTMATRDLKRSDFPNGLYHTFSVDFKARAGHRYSFCTFWQYSPAAPRLTQRSVILRPADVTILQ